MKIIGIIPARLNSTRLPRKMLALINGKPLIYWTWQNAKKAKLLDDLVVATDSKEIYNAVKSFGGKAILGKSAESGSQRVAHAAKYFPKAELIINVQGDQPILSPGAIDAVIKELLKDDKVLTATVGTSFDDDQEIDQPTFAKIALDNNNNALYFSRSRIPYPRYPYNKFVKHIGIYGFRRDFLLKFAKMAPTPLEKAESLEQLRILENGYKIKVALGKFKCVSVDIASDLARVKKELT
jgi:3-deoxy-manno-octulosonate cytidylyltransferase (CMP-KDO synthetase)